ncbi:MAG TPA: BON domain-containing protein [Planctomycetaceae bacterium]|jgi:osmotically-inducible protein OsmY|nr:BON domain-containing protein [Planctomycetaceae bacterium]
MVAPRNLTHRPADQALERTVESTLLNHDPFRFRRVTARAQAGVVVLTGSVNTYYAKSLGLRLTQRLPGVLTVIDSVSVTRPLERTLGRDDF